MAAFSVADSLDDIRIAFETYSNTSTFFMAGQQSSTPYYSVARFLPTIPQGSTILTAFMTLVCSNASSGTAVLTNLYLEDVDDAARIASFADYADRVTRPWTAAVPWDNIGAWTLAASYDTPSLVVPIQTVVNRALWASGQGMNVYWVNDGSDDGACRFGSSQDSATYTEPVLTVTWTPPASTRRIFVVS